MTIVSTKLVSIFHPIFAVVKTQKSQEKVIKQLRRRKKDGLLKINWRN